MSLDIQTRGGRRLRGLGESVLVMEGLRDCAPCQLEPGHIRVPGYAQPLPATGDKSMVVAKSGTTAAKTVLVDEKETSEGAARSGAWLFVAGLVVGVLGTALYQSVK